MPFLLPKSVRDVLPPDDDDLEPWSVESKFIALLVLIGLILTWCGVG